MIFKNIIFILSSMLFLGCAPSSITPISNANKALYSGEAQLLIAVDGTDGRAVRHIEVYSDEEPLGYEVYFHDTKVSDGFIAINIPTPSTNVRLKEYSLTGHYGCSRGKAGYGSGTKTIPKVTNNHTYFLGTINTSMNTMYDEMPESLMKEAKSKYHYTPHGTDFEKKDAFRTHISL
jgi:hypothetical protein